VAQAAAEAYRAFRYVVEILPLDGDAAGIQADDASEPGWVLMLRDQLTVEWVLTGVDELQALRPMMAELVRAGWTVRALVPMSEIGIGQSTLRGVRAELQGWWSDESANLRFSAPRIA
jgi:hypothetical protein